jgi:hypothetical protein
MSRNIKQGLIAAVLLGATIMSTAAAASSHREAPLITEDPTVDSTDVYMFRSPENPEKVVILANYIPLQDPAGAPNYFNFSNSALYRINIDNDGDAAADIIYEFRFRFELTTGDTWLYQLGAIDTLENHNANRNLKQFYTLTRLDIADDGSISSTVIADSAQTTPARIGPRSNGSQQDYETLVNQLIHEDTDTDTRAFVGQRDEGFYIDINAIFDLLNISRTNGLGDGQALDGTAGLNVSTLGIEIPITALTADGQLPELGDNLGGPNAVIGTWTSAHRRKHRVLRRNKNPRNFGPFVQVSRLGLPLINEIVVPLGFKDQFNRSEPKDDLTNIAGFVVDPELSRLLRDVHGLTVPDVPRNDMVSVISFLPGALTSNSDLQPADILRLNVAIPPATSPNRLGVIGGDVAGFPNGRRVQDDVVDILEQVVGGGILAEGFGDVFPNNALNDAIDENDVPFLESFPFLATPHEGFVHSHDVGPGFED